MKKTVLREYYEAILVAFILALFVRTFVFENFKIPSGSMEDNLLVGDHLVVNKYIYAHTSDTFLHRFLHRFLPYRPPKRGDVVVFKFPNNPRRDFIKRCVAVAGDTIQMRVERRQVEWGEGEETRSEERTVRVLHVNGEATPFSFREGWYLDRGVRTSQVIQLEHPGQEGKSYEVYYKKSREKPRNKQRDFFGPYTVPEGKIFCLGDNRDNSSDCRYWGAVPLSHVKGRAVLIYWSYEAEKGDWEWRGLRHRLFQLGEVVVHFPTKTRWKRQFRLIK